MTHSRLASPSATIALLTEHGLYTRKSLGQHFLVDDNVVGRILALAALSPADAVLEVGPGIGTLTVALASAAGHVVAVERDSRLVPVLSELAEETGNLTIVEADAVDVPVPALETPLGPPVALVANLPYAVAATVVLRYFEEIPSLRSAVVMVQAEVADRMTASPGTKSYGAYSVKLQLLARPAGRFAVARGCFLPPPRVDSAVVRLERASRTGPAGSLPGEPLLRDTARAADAAFAQRRKTLRNSLKASLGDRGVETGGGDVAGAKGALDAALAGAGIDGGRRAETLSVDEFIILADQLGKHGLLP